MIDCNSQWRLGIECYLCKKYCHNKYLKSGNFSRGTCKDRHGSILTLRKPNTPLLYSFSQQNINDDVTELLRGKKIVFIEKYVLNADHKKNGFSFFSRICCNIWGKWQYLQKIRSKYRK